MNADTFIKAQLAAHSWRWAPEGARPVLQCIAFVVRNRVRAGWHGGDWLKLMEEEANYRASASPVAVLLNLQPPLQEDGFRLFLQNDVDRLYGGELTDTMTEGALWWAVGHAIDRPWFEEKIARNPEEHPRVAQVGALMLWR